MEPAPRIVCIALCAAALAGGHPRAQTAAPARGLTDVAGVKVGHFTLAERPTGCTVVLTEAGQLDKIAAEARRLFGGRDFAGMY